MWGKGGAIHSHIAMTAITMYIQYFSINDFSRGCSMGLPSADTGGGTRSAGLHSAPSCVIYGSIIAAGGAQDERRTRPSVPLAMNRSTPAKREKRCQKAPEAHRAAEQERARGGRAKKEEEDAQRWERRRSERDCRVGNRPELGGARSRTRARLAADGLRARAVVRHGTHKVIEGKWCAMLVEVDRKRFRGARWQVALKEGRRS